MIFREKRIVRVITLQIAENRTGPLMVSIEDRYRIGEIRAVIHMFGENRSVDGTVPIAVMVKIKAVILGALYNGQINICIVNFK